MLLAAVAFALSTVFSGRYMAPAVPDPHRPPSPPDIGVFTTIVADAAARPGGGRPRGAPAAHPRRAGPLRPRR